MIPRIVSEYRPQPPPPDEYAHARRRAGVIPTGGIEIDQTLFSAKKERSKVFTGRKNAFLKEVPSLYNCCIRVLSDNIDGLTYTGGVPFDILKPVLERATPEQLFRIEDWNPYLVEDTDGLWENLCRRDFKTAQREELESWREVYERMQEERELKFQKIKSTIHGSNKKAEASARHTILAIAAAPKGAKRKTDVFGNNRLTPVATTEQVLENRRRNGAHMGGGNRSDTSATKSTASVAASSSDSDAVFVNLAAPSSAKRFKTIEGTKKKKMAPLMAKTLKMMKQSRR